MSKFKYAINTNTLKKNMSPADIVKLAVAVGADGIEWGIHRLETAAAEVKEMHRLTTDAGLEIAGFLNAGQLWKTDLIRQWSEAVAPAGNTTLRVAHPWFAYNYDEALHQRESFLDLAKRARDGLEKLVPLGKEFGLRYVLEMHGGSVAASAPMCRQLMEGLNPACIGVIYDPANTVIEGFIRPRGSVEILGEYLAYIHAKNLGFRPTGYQAPDAPTRYTWERYYTRLENGMVDYVEIMFALKHAGFSGWICLEEYFAGRPDIPKEISEGINFLKACAESAPSAPQKPFTTFND